MNIGMIVYSETGNTYFVALKLKDKLAKSGHSVTIERIEATGTVRPGAKNLVLKNSPEVDKYDALVFAAPVMAFSLSPVMKLYLTNLPSLKNKKIACFVTKQLPFYWTGGHQAIKWIGKTCESKGGEISSSGVVVWSSKQRDKNITEVIERLNRLF